MADAQSAMQILRALRKGHNVCLFAEGNRSFSGRDRPRVPGDRQAGARFARQRS